MSGWTAGYVSDILYTSGFYPELVPRRLQISRLQAGGLASEPAAYCELGCGQGFSANLLAAANPQVEFHATDFNPAQIAGARALAAEAGTKNITFYDAAFADFAGEPGLPAAFDIIALHGIYSWISADNRRIIVDFIRKRLKIGGLVYISYNALPGWAPAMPLRRLLVDQAQARPGPLGGRITEAVGFLDKLAGVDAAFLGANPALAPRIERMKTHSHNYLAHEYFNRDWTPFYFADVVAELAEAKLTFVGSAHFLDHVDAINLTESQIALLAEEKDPIRREALRDFLVNQQFRRDLFVKGPLPAPARLLREAWLDSRFALVTPREDVELKVKGIRGEAMLQSEVYAPILDELAKGPRVLRQIVADAKLETLGWARLLQALTILVGTGQVQPCLTPKDEARRALVTRAFNAAVCKRAEDSADLQSLASPVTGGGIPVDQVTQLFLAAHAAKNPDPAAAIWSLMAAQGRSIVKNDKPLETAEENVGELRVVHGDFIERRLPLLKQLGIV